MSGTPGDLAPDPEITVEVTLPRVPRVGKADEIASGLGKISIFADLPGIYRDRIASLGTEEDYAQGTQVFAQGTPGDKLYVILAGSIRISRRTPGRGEDVLGILRTGDCLGEMAIIDDFPRSVDAIAHESCRLLVLSRERLADLLFVDRDLAYELLWSFVRALSARLRETNDTMVGQ